MGLHLKQEADLENCVDANIIHVFSDQSFLQIGTNYKDHAYEKEELPVEQTDLSNGNKDVEVDIAECTKSSNSEPLLMGDTCDNKDDDDDDDDDDATECSSSFGDTGSVSDNDLTFSDDEVESFMYDKDPFSSLFFRVCEPGLKRWKRFTNHFENFIRPLRRRYKWIELNLKQLQSQKHKYEKELASYDYRRHLTSENFSVDGCDTKSMPTHEGIRLEKAIKRKKRKRIEETCNLATFTSDHYIFSHYEQKDHAPLKNAKIVAKVARNSKTNEEFTKGDGIFFHLDNYLLSSLDHTNTDKTMKNIFDQIEAAQFKVHQLSTRVVKVVNENVGKSSPVNNVNMLGLVPSNGLNLHDRNSASCSGIKNTFLDRNWFMRKTKQSVEEHKSVSFAQASSSDLVAKNAVSNLRSENDLQVCSPSKSNVCEKKMGEGINLAETGGCN